MAGLDSPNKETRVENKTNQSRFREVTIRRLTIADYDQVIALWSTTEAMLLRDALNGTSVNSGLN